MSAAAVCLLIRQDQVDCESEGVMKEEVPRMLVLLLLVVQEQMAQEDLA